MTSELRLPFDDDRAAAQEGRPTVARRSQGGPTSTDRPDAAATQAAVDPTQNIVLEASAGTGKTRVLVERYVNLLRAGVDPDNILAITFTRKAAAEMRQRIIERLKEASRLSQLDAGRWRDLRERLGDIAISTIDAFCLSLLREFPLEADVDPGFDLADDTEVPRLIDEALDRALRISPRHRARRRRRRARVRAARRAAAPRGARRAARPPAGGAGRRCAGSCRAGPRDLTAARACETPRRGCGACSRRAAAASTRS